ncbi:hypothetical protein [Lactiplantibacillus pingfangensis]|uniref:hypothetical protein n=1 Tax=Lactiplantibacillus pingfangensis TaxID=2559915 RepID=UPI0010F4B16A|nr:hypothetical protein [Lactiplantibacillus pingfangensis]
MTFFYGLLFVTMLGLLIIIILTFRLNRQLTDGTLLSTRELANFMVKLADFNQAHPHAGRLAKRYEHGWRIQGLGLASANILGLAWLAFLPATLGISFLLFLAIITLAATALFVVTLTSYYRVTKIYDAHQLRLNLSKKLHGRVYFYTSNVLMLLLGYELIGLLYYLFDLIA